MKLTLRVADPCGTINPCPRIYEDEAGNFWTQGYAPSLAASFEGAPPPPPGETLHRLPRWLLLDLARQLRDEGVL